jgi:hypothetical protein
LRTERSSRHGFRRLAVVALVVSLCPAAVGSGGSPEAPADDATARRLVLAEESRKVRRVTGTVRARYADPQRLAAGIGFVVAHLPEDWTCAAACDHQGLSGQFEIGPAGAQAGIGWGRVIGPRTRRGSFLVRPHLGFAFRAIALRTWDGAHLDPPARTFAGVEGAFSIVGLSATLSVLRETAGPAVGEWRIGGGFGWGF